MQGLKYEVRYKDIAVIGGECQIELKGMPSDEQEEKEMSERLKDKILESTLFEIMQGTDEKSKHITSMMFKDFQEGAMNGELKDVSIQGVKDFHKKFFTIKITGVI